MNFSHEPTNESINRRIRKHKRFASKGLNRPVGQINCSHSTVEIVLVTQLTRIDWITRLIFSVLLLAKPGCADFCGPT